MATQAVTALAARNIRKILEDRGLTQEWLSSASGISMRTLSRRIHATHPNGTTLEELGAIARALKIPMTALIARPSASNIEAVAA
ncbi:helix-turn-helix transcriptional regulator [Leucobacter sp. CSA1]|uniref:Helix-turn-helix transcriptional regulator n=1 Tax=Leucobacter chromiisoli TaxID=2796471 RepID=A0A934QAX2_9MICO|nr:helix-turn-helix transcriptional regulator [Leucobacter chromiisoli]MBK0420391.1 helix-turn-helix transcriptional regulator [Leucobacter chromiisoli]